MDHISLRERLHYQFDQWMSRGTGAIMALLGLATAGFVILLAVIVVVLHAYPNDAKSGDFWDIVWGNLMRTLDPGTMGADVGWAYRSLMLVATVGGLVVVASLIGIISGAFDQRMLQLRKGRSRVLEKDHTLIVGWSSNLFTIIDQICLANESKKKNTIVILADRDKVEMEDEIQARIHTHHTTKIICRQGDPLSHLDLRLASPSTARRVVVLSDQDATHKDAARIKTVMSLINQIPSDSDCTIVAELHDPANLEAARLAGTDRTRWLLADELVSRLTVQTCLHRGLSTVCIELLDFEGNEIYFSQQPNLVDATYLEAQHAFEDSIVIDIRRDSHLQINPPTNKQIQPGDELILISEDDSTIRTALPGTAETDAIYVYSPKEQLPERTLILGCNTSIQQKLQDLSSYLPAGSSIDLVAEVTPSSLSAPAHIELRVTQADTTSRAVLEELNIDQYDHVLVLAYRELHDAQTVDAKTIVTLLHLRDIAAKSDPKLNIVSEILVDANRQLAEVKNVDDFIVSDRLSSLMISQVSENPHLIGLFEQLFTSGGSEIYLHPYEHYIKPGLEVDFYTISAAAAAHQETAIGYRIATDQYDSKSNFGVVLNPLKHRRVRFAHGDSVIVLAESG